MKRKIFIGLLLAVLLCMFGCTSADRITEDMYVSDLDVAGDILPDINNIRDLGSNALYWNSLWVTNINGAPYAGGGGGDVSAAANLADNTIIRGDGGLKGVQDSGITIDDFDNLDTNGGDITGFDIWADNDVNITNDLDVTDDADIGGNLQVTGSASISTLTSGRLPFIAAGGLLTDELGFEYDTATNTLSVDHINAPTGRSVTYVVAASDAPAHVKAQADYVCDGTADDVEIAAAIAALPAGGGSIQLMGSSFSISSKITISKSYVTICGESIEFPTLTLANNVNDDMFYITSGTYCVRMENLHLAGNRYNQTAGSGVRLVVVYDNEFKSIFFDSFKEYGCKIETKSTGLSFVDCYMGNNGRSGMYLRSEQDFFYQCCFYGNAQYGIEIRGYNVDPPPVASVGTESTFLSCRFQGNLWSGIYMDESSYGQPPYGYQFIGCQVVGNYQHGFYLKGAKRNIIQDCTIRDNSQQTTNTYDGIFLDNSTHYNCEYNVIANSIILSQWAKVQRYGINESDANQTNNQITGNIIKGNGTGGVNKGGSSSLIFGNKDYIAPGEVRTASGSLTGGAANAILFAWHNPELQDIVIKKVVIYITTADADAANIDCGIADDASYTNGGTEFFDDLAGETAQINDSWVAGDGGTQTKWVFCQDSASATDGWIVAKILDNDGSSIVGSYYIEYEGK